MHFRSTYPLFALLGTSLASPLLNTDSDSDINAHVRALEKRIGPATGVTTQGNLTSGLPGGCAFPVGSSLNYAYWDCSGQTPDGGSCCVGAITGGLPRPGCQAWNRENTRNILAAASDQLALDGQFQHSKVGLWMGEFAWLTTAFDDRTLDYFQSVFEANNCEGCSPYEGTGSANWLYSRHYNFMQVDFLGIEGNCDDNKADPADPGGDTWNDPYGPVAVGSFSWFIVPRWTMNDQDTATATVCCPPFLPSPNPSLSRSLNSYSPVHNLHPRRHDPKRHNPRSLGRKLHL